MALRTINYTGRKRISREDILIVLNDDDGRIIFDASLKLDRYKFPEDAHIFLEAYRQTQWMRFYYGRIGRLEPPSDRSLYEFDTSEGILFRVKVVASGETSGEKRGKLIAEADRIRPRTSEGEEERRIPLLHVKRSNDLGEEIFRLEYDSTQVLLLVNAHLTNCTAIVKDPVFFALVFPGVLRDILNRILLIDKHTDMDDREDWRSCWLYFASRLPGVVAPPQDADEDEIYDWVNSAVASFSRLHHVKNMFDKHYWRGGT